ncbi:hypothetical protein VTK56DRAFT_6024 [Thermocarpiscus australiensis]
MLTQCFDIASLNDPFHRSYKQVKGLQESSREILDLVNQESAKVSRENIIFGDAPVGRFVGISGWLPFSYEINPIIGLYEDEDGSGSHGDDRDRDLFGPADDDPFGKSANSSGEERTPVVKVLAHVRDLISLDIKEIPCTERSAMTTPIFLGHGEADEKIRDSLGVSACRTLRSLGFHVVMRSYKDLGHWYKIPDEIDDIVDFVHHGGAAASS